MTSKASILINCIVVASLLFFGILSIGTQAEAITIPLALFSVFALGAWRWLKRRGFGYVFYTLSFGVIAMNIFAFVSVLICNPRDIDLLETRAMSYDLQRIVADIELIASTNSMENSPTEFQNKVLCYFEACNLLDSRYEAVLFNTNKNVWVLGAPTNDILLAVIVNAEIFDRSGCWGVVASGRQKWMDAYETNDLVYVEASHQKTNLQKAQKMPSGFDNKRPWRSDDL